MKDQITKLANFSHYYKQNGGVIGLDYVQDVDNLLISYKEMLEDIRMLREAVKKMRSTYPYEAPCLHWEDKAHAHNVAEKSLTKTDKYEVGE